MATIQIDGGTFSDSPYHEYRDTEGKWVPSLTQILKFTGISDYSGIDTEVLENAARRGTEVHALAAAYNKWGELDPTWIHEETKPYYDAYMQFVVDTGFIPDSDWSERPLIATVCGFKFGCTPDCHGTLGKDKAIIELKATATVQPSWTVQTALQEAAIYKSNRCGRVRRHSLMLRKDGKYRLSEEHMKHDEDMAIGLAALRIVWWRLNHGQKLAAST